MTDPADPAAAPLAGVRVVELGVWVAGPAAAGLLADWGADVVKVEPPSGDPQRAVFGALGLGDQPAVPPFELDNRGKRSVVLDLRDEAERATMDALLARADVFVTNLRPDALGRLGLDAASVRARHPRLVYAGLSGYGREGPEAWRPGYDVGAFWARSGVAHTLVPPDEYPPNIRSGFGDHVTGMSLAAGVLAALFQRERTGQGTEVHTSLLRAGMWCLGWDIGIQLRFAKRESTRPRARMRAPLVNVYKARDGRGFWLIALEGDRHWPGVVRALGHPELLADERFTDATARLANTEALIAELDRLFATRPYDEWVERFDAEGVWWAPLNSIPDVIADPQARAAGGFVAMAPHEGEDPYEAVASPVDFEGHTLRPGRVPRLGEHTDEVRRELDEG